MKLLKCSLHNFESPSRFAYFSAPGEGPKPEPTVLNFGGAELTGSGNRERRSEVQMIPVAPDAAKAFDKGPKVAKDTAQKASDKALAKLAAVPTLSEDTIGGAVEKYAAGRKAAKQEAPKHAKESSAVRKEWAARKIETAHSPLQAGETVRLTGGKVNMRDTENGKSVGKLAINQVVTIASNPEPVTVGGLTFIKINNPAGGEAYVATKFLETTLPTDVSYVAKRAEKYHAIGAQPREKAELKVEIPEGRMARETVLWRAAQPGSPVDPSKAWEAFVKAYQSAPLALDIDTDSEVTAYKKVFGDKADIYEDKMKTVWDAVKDRGVANAKITEEVSLPGGVDPEKAPQALATALGKLGHEVASFYKMTTVPTGKEIMQLFNVVALKGWGAPDSSVKFDYMNGNILLHAPAQEGRKAIIGEAGQSAPAAAAQEEVRGVFTALPSELLAVRSARNAERSGRSA